MSRSLRNVDITKYPIKVYTKVGYDDIDIVEMEICSAFR